MKRVRSVNNTKRYYANKQSYYLLQIQRATLHVFALCSYYPIWNVLTLSHTAKTTIISVDDDSKNDNDNDNVDTNDTDDSDDVDTEQSKENVNPSLSKQHSVCISLPSLMAGT